MYPFIATVTTDTSLLSDAGSHIGNIALAFVAALALGVSIPIARKVYKMVKGAIGGA